MTTWQDIGSPQVVYAPAEPTKWTQTICVGNVRWFDGKLQQLFSVTEFVSGFPSTTREEWRDVPSVPSPPSKEGE